MHAKKHSRYRSKKLGNLALSLYGKRTKQVRNWRKVAGGVFVLTVFGLSLFAQNFSHFFQLNNYDLSPETLSIIGDVRDDAADHLKLNEDMSAYEFFVPDEEATESTEHTGRVASAYSANFNIDPNQGVQVVEKSTQISMRLIPKFYVGEGKKTPSNQVVYPFGKNQLVYSLKYNGLKEDIIIPEFIDDELSYEFSLELPIGAEARLEQDGSIGIYSADEVLYGNMSYGSDEDKERIEKARMNSEKNNLIASIPAPIIIDAAFKEYSDRSEFTLKHEGNRKSSSSSELPDEIKEKMTASSTIEVYTLGINSKELKELTYPISIDPTFQITDAAEFAGTEFGPGVELDTTNNLIRRGSLTGGTVAGWGSTTNLPTDMLSFQSLIYNGYLYLVGGDRSGGGAGSGSVLVDYTKLNSDGSFASDAGCGAAWCSTSSMNTGRRLFTAGVARGYIYAFGGETGGGTYTDTVEYAKINSNGTLGAWTYTASLLSDRGAGSSEVVDGYVYLIGGANSSFTAGMDSSDYARLDANGAIATDSGCGSSWCSNSALPTRRVHHGVKAYNGWLYLIGGRWGANLYDTTYYSRINGDGTLGSWTQTTSMSSIRYGHGLEIWNGYMYATGGCSTYAGSGECQAGFFLNTVEYAPINASGSIGTWRTTDSFTTQSLNHGSAVWNGYLYVLGGCISGICQYTNRSQFTAIDSAGALHDSTWSSTTGFTTGRRYPTVEVYNGCMYVIAGWSSATGYQNTVQYATINDDGSVGSWTVSGNTLTTARRNHSSVIYGGYLYVLAGYDGANEIDSVEYAAVNADCSIGSFVAGSALLQSEQAMSSAAYNGYLYTSGGNSVGGDRVQRATINSSDGSIGAWSEVGSYSDLQLNHVMHIHNGYMYLVGGNNAASNSYGVRYAPIASDGTLPTPAGWTTAASFTTGRKEFGSVIHNGYLYILGGRDMSDTALSDVQRAPLNSDGSLGSWSTTTSLDQTRYLFDSVVHGGNLYVVGGFKAGVSFNSDAVDYQVINNGGSGGPVDFTPGPGVSNRKNHALLAYNGFLYSLGGCSISTCTTATNNSYYAPLNADGSIGTWGVTTAFSVGRYNHYAFVNNDRIYVVGGRNSGGTNLRSIEFATIAGNGTIGSWSGAGLATPTTFGDPAFTVYNNHLYMLGGQIAETTTRFTSIDTSTGEPGPSWTTTTALPEGRYRMWTIAYKGYIYAIGGNSTAGRRRSVYYAPINSDHTIGTWVRSANDINAPANAATNTSIFAFNGYIYLGGGDQASGFYYPIQYAAVHSGGDVGKWQTGITTGLPDHGNYSIAVHDGTMYTSGGQSLTNNPSSDSRYATLDTVPRVGGFSKKYSFEAGVRPEKLITRGQKQTDSVVDFWYANNVNCDNSAYGNQQLDTNLSFGSANLVNIDLGGPTLARCLIVNYEIDDRLSSVFPDTGNETYITDFDLNFISNPGNRLRGGRNFTNGIDRGLQASPQ